MFSNFLFIFFLSFRSLFLEGLDDFFSLIFLSISQTGFVGIGSSLYLGKMCQWRCLSVLPKSS